MEGYSFETDSYDDRAFLTTDDSSSIVRLVTSFPEDVLYIEWDGYEPVELRIQEVHITTTKASAVYLEVRHGENVTATDSVSPVIFKINWERIHSRLEHVDE